MNLVKSQVMGILIYILHISLDSNTLITTSYQLARSHLPPYYFTSKELAVHEKRFHVHNKCPKSSRIIKEVWAMCILMLSLVKNWKYDDHGDGDRLHMSS
jgi:hypothetical protein